MKKFQLLILFLLIPFMVQASILDDQLNLTVDNIIYNGEDLGIKANFQYSGMQDGYHNWRLINIEDGQVYSEYDLELQTLINNHRISLGLNQLQMVKIIWDQCLQHNKDMSEGRVPFGHDGMVDRINNIQQVMPVWYAVENAGMGYRTPLEQFNGWLTSPGHKENMEHPSLTHMGVSHFGIYTTFLAVQSR